MVGFTKNVFLFGLFSIILTFPALSQRIITGKVISADGTELPGVNVLLKGSNSGTITDIYGNYSIKIPEEGGSLEFTYIGYQKEEIEIANLLITIIRIIWSCDIIIISIFGILENAAG